MLANCTSVLNNPNSTKPDILDNSQISTIINNKKSMTASLKQLNNHFSVSVLFNGLENKQYRRIVAIKLESTPVLVAMSSTSLKNKTFYNILSNSKDSSIGLKLFASNGKIKRDQNMQITKLKIKDIENNGVHNYILSLGYNDDQRTIKRSSIFRHQNESMQLTEYILPSINEFITSNK